jgi:hypothetical protein
MKSYCSEILENITPIHNKTNNRNEKLQFLKDLVWIGERAQEWLEIDKELRGRNELAAGNC